MKSKAELRTAILGIRNALSIEYRWEASLIIARGFMQHWGGYERYALYSSMRSEVSTTVLMDSLLRTKKTVLLPKMVSGSELHWGNVERLTESRFGIMEPRQACPESDFDVIVVPCAAFDRDCHRIGYGKGCYDRFLAQATYRAAVILAFDVQLVDSALPDPYDIAADAVQTEKEIISRGKK